MGIYSSTESDVGSDGDSSLDGGEQAGGRIFGLGLGGGGACASSLPSSDDERGGKLLGGGMRPGRAIGSSPVRMFIGSSAGSRASSVESTASSRPSSVVPALQLSTMQPPPPPPKREETDSPGQKPVAKPAVKPPGKGKAPPFPGKAPPFPGKAPPFPGKAPPFPGKAPPMVRKLPGAAGPFGTRATLPASLPIGRKLSLRAGRCDAAAFRGAYSLTLDAGEFDGDCEEAGPRTARARTSIDFSALQCAFKPKARRSTSLTGRISKKQADQVELLPRQAAQNLAIVLARLKVDTEELATSLEALRPGSRTSLSADDVDLFLDVWPSDSVLKPMVEYVKSGKDASSLRDVERRLLPLIVIPRVGQRLRLLALMGALDARIEEGLRKLALLQRACGELQRSELLREVLAIVVLVFNYVNFGMENPDEVVRSARGEPSGTSGLRGVDVQSLLRLRETKAYAGEFPGFNMLHYVVQQLLDRRGPQLSSQCLGEQLESVPQAARASLLQALDELLKLKADHAFVQNELRDHRDAYVRAVPDARKEGAAAAVIDSAVEVPVDARGFLERTMGRGVDLASMAMAWMRGDEVMGKPYHPLFAYEAFRPSVGAADEDGQAPPPGWLCLCRASGQWQRVWCEVRTSVLVVYRNSADGERCVGAIYVALPSADIFAVEKDIAQDGSVAAGLQVRSSTGGQKVLLAAGSAAEAERWLTVLKRRAEPVAGCAAACYLLAASSPSPSVAPEDGRLLFCCLSFQSGGGRVEMLGFARPRDGVEGTPPVRTWGPFGGGCSACFSVQDLATWRKTVASESPDDATPSSPPATGGISGQFGFVLEEEVVAADHSGYSTLYWHFTCSSYDEERAWLQTLGDLLKEDSLPSWAREAASGLQAPKAAVFASEAQSPPCWWTQPQSATGEQLAAERRRAGEEAQLLASRPVAESMDEREEDQEGGSAKGFEERREREEPLQCFEEELASQVRRWERALAAAERDCFALLGFFGLEAPQQHGPSLGAASGQLFEAMVEFTRQIRAAWEDIERHRAAKAQRDSQRALRPKLGKKKSLRPRPEEVPAAAEAPESQGREGEAAEDPGAPKDGMLSAAL
eukprot:TRINITY_DN21800_c0_g1_i1.p1 TRINITY_DN21800_c0_g1~~TRINITY_DN21800_c0_g1_i1.p1  ORF type:complete len:1092 (-),score=296.12 TRINITY_DN21800_c0_g1_i1:206-3481(-)